ncbi:MAG: hypothetical protein ACRC6R_10385 [Bacteroidales bacterium]
MRITKNKIESLLLLLIITLIGCSEINKSDYEPIKGVVPTGLKSVEVVSMNAPSITLSSGLDDQLNDLSIYEFGIIVSTNDDPILSEEVSILKSSSPTISSFEVTFQGMKSEQKYYARSYALNANGASYGEILSFDAPYISPLLELSGSYKVSEYRLNLGVVNPYDISIQFTTEYDQEEDETYEYLEVTGLGCGPNNWNSKATSFKIIPLMQEGGKLHFMIPFSYVDIKLDTTYPAAMVNYKWAIYEDDDMNMFGEIDLEKQIFTLRTPYTFLKVDNGVVTSTYYYAAESSIWTKNKN